MPNAKSNKDTLVSLIAKAIQEAGYETLPINWTGRAVPSINVKIRDQYGRFDYYEVKVTGPKYS